MPLQAPLRLDRFQQGLFSVVSDAMGPTTSVTWGLGQAVYESLEAELVVLTVPNGPGYFNQNHARATTILPFDSITIDVTGATAGVRDVISVNCIDYFVDADGVITDEDIRDAFVIALNENSNDPWSAADGAGSTELVITPDSFGAIWSLEILGELAAISQTVSGNAASLTQGTRTITVGIQCFAKNRTLRAGAAAMIAKIQSIFEDPGYSADLSVFGIGVWDKGPCVDISAIAGANWESRYSMDVQMAMRSAITRPVDHIETINATIYGECPPGTVIATETFTVTAP